MFYKPDNDRAKMEQNRVNCTIKLRNDQIEHIEKTARNEEEVLMLTKQIQEHGDFTDPIQERLESIAAGKNVEMQAELTEVRKQMDELTKQNAELLAALRREREGAAKTTKAAAKK